MQRFGKTRPPEPNERSSGRFSGRLRVVAFVGAMIAVDVIVFGAMAFGGVSVFRWLFG
jgi:hypothetical protein